MKVVAFFFAAKIPPSLVDPRSTSLGFAYPRPVSHTSQQLPSRLGLFSLTLHLSLSLTFFLFFSADVPRNPFSRRRRQKRGSGRKKRLPSPTVTAFPGETALKTCLLWTRHNELRDSRGYMFFIFCIRHN